MIPAQLEKAHSYTPASKEEVRVAALRIEGLATGLIGPVSFDIAAGECVALMGASGAGKSLLLRAIVDLDPSTGNVWVGDQVRNDMPATKWRKLVALVPAVSGWWADRVSDHFPSKSGAKALIEGLGLADSLDWEVSRLSTGECQRLAIARALCRKPEALLLDEPAASLDEQATRRVEDLMLECCRAGMALLLVTHDRQQAERTAERVLHMSSGRMEEPLRSVA
jgi:ABC-type multidrug transport system ATPase subunit